MTDDMDRVFKALADGSRRQLLDLLHADQGQTLGALAGREQCDHSPILSTSPGVRGHADGHQVRVHAL